MSATNPFLTSDLISKYGWQILPYLSGLGVNLLSESQILFVDSGSSNALDADDTEHGHSFEKPLATIDYAIGLCTAGQGDVILVAPGHTETLDGASDIDFDVDDINCIGIGSGDNRPTLTVATDSDEGAPIEIAADNILFKNFRIVGGKTGGSQDAIVISGSYVTLEDCVFYESVNTKELAVANNYGIVTIDDSSAAVTDVTLRRCSFDLASGGNDESAIALTDGSNGLTRLLVEDCSIRGTFADSAIQLDQGTNPLTDCIIKGTLILNDLATGGAGACVGVDSGDSLVMVDCHALSADGDAEPISNDAASYLSNVFTCEKGAYGVTTANGSATDWSS